MGTAQVPAEAPETVSVRLFSVLRDRLGVGELQLSVEGVDTVDDALDALSKEYATIERYRPWLRCAVNRQYVGVESPIRGGDELALITPVSGG